MLSQLTPQDLHGMGLGMGYGMEDVGAAAAARRSITSQWFGPDIFNGRKRSGAYGEAGYVRVSCEVIGGNDHIPREVIGERKRSREEKWNFSSMRKIQSQILRPSSEDEVNVANRQVQLESESDYESGSGLGNTSGKALLE